MELLDSVIQKYDYARRLLIARAIILRLRATKWLKRFRNSCSTLLANNAWYKSKTALGAVLLAGMGGILYFTQFGLVRDSASTEVADLNMPDVSKAGVIERSMADSLSSVEKVENDQSNSETSLPEETSFPEKFVESTENDEPSFTQDDLPKGPEFESSAAIAFSRFAEEEAASIAETVRQSAQIPKSLSTPVSEHSELVESAEAKPEKVSESSFPYSASNAQSLSLHSSAGNADAEITDQDSVKKIASLQSLVETLNAQINQLRQETRQLEAQLLEREIDFNQAEKQRNSSSPKSKIVYNITNIPVGGYVSTEQIQKDSNSVDGLSPGTDVFNGSDNASLEYNAGVSPYDQNEAYYRDQQSNDPSLQMDVSNYNNDNQGSDSGEEYYNDDSSFQYDATVSPYEQSDAYVEELPYDSSLPMDGSNFNVGNEDPYMEGGQAYIDPQYGQLYTEQGTGVTYGPEGMPMVDGASQVGQDAQPYTGGGFDQYGMPYSGEYQDPNLVAPYDPYADTNGS